MDGYMFVVDGWTYNVYESLMSLLHKKVSNRHGKQHSIQMKCPYGKNHSSKITVYQGQEWRCNPELIDWQSRELTTP